jgi:hypothetical protein
MLVYNYVNVLKLRSLDSSIGVGTVLSTEESLFYFRYKQEFLLLSTNTELNKKWSCTSTSHIRFNGLHKEPFTFTIISSTIIP